MNILEQSNQDVIYLPTDDTQMMYITMLALDMLENPKIIICYFILKTLHSHTKPILQFNQQF